MAKYFLYKEVKDEGILSHLLFNCMPREMIQKIADESKNKTNEEREKTKVDIKLLINGESIDPKPFFDLFVEQYEEHLRRAASTLVQEQVSEKFREIGNKLSEYQEITESWAKDINWQVDNQFERK